MITRAACVVCITIFLTSLHAHEQNTSHRIIFSSDTSIIEEKLQALRSLAPGDFAYIDEQYITNSKLHPLIVQKHKEGVLVEVITGLKNSNKQVAQRLARSGIPVWIGRIHTKNGLFGSTLFITSENSSMQAGKHEECAYISYADQSLIEEYCKQHNEIKSYCARIAPNGFIPQLPKMSHTKEGKMILLPKLLQNKVMLSSLNARLVSCLSHAIKKPIPKGYHQRIMASTMTLHTPIKNALLQKAQEKDAHVSISLVMDQSAEHHADDLVAKDVKVYVYEDKENQIPSLNHVKAINITNSPNSPKTPSRPTTSTSMIMTNNFTNTNEINAMIVIPNSPTIRDALTKGIDSIAKKSIAWNMHPKRRLFPAINDMHDEV